MKAKLKNIIKTKVSQRKSAGLTTAEYAVVTIAATTFAGVLIVVVKSGAVQNILQNLVETALSVF
ncbi:MAG: DUF4244 domain-containing protein [Bifidobacteriaceae bacterium]|jgi:hypothetical protein|nr:DUF4244 domain-containing protein [Bifidobacteriaceae bacterium]